MEQLQNPYRMPRIYDNFINIWIYYVYIDDYGYILVCFCELYDYYSNTRYILDRIFNPINRIIKNI